MSEPALLNRPKSKMDLFLSFTWLALQGFGGVLAVVQRVLVEEKRWMSKEQFVEDWAVAQIMPGPNVVNLSLMLGDRFFGLRGALVSSHDVNGTAVYSPQREHLGHIDHVMIDKTSGTIGYAVLAFGGFLGLGENHVPMPWKTLRYDTDVGGYVTDLTPEQLRAAPEAPS